MELEFSNTQEPFVFSSLGEQSEISWAAVFAALLLGKGWLYLGMTLEESGSANLFQKTDVSCQSFSPGEPH